MELETEGEDTELDRTMADALGDPLIHMVRNAVDHGIESPEDRVKRGKDATGKVRLRAFHAGGNVVVQLTDDGGGLDKNRIIEKAISKGMITSSLGMTDGEIFALIFEPGFSTRDQVTDVSGRGVGMDVVKRAVDAIKGRIEITSEPGKGTVFSIYLPLTLAITDGMLVRVGEERFILPTVDIQLSVRPESKALSTLSNKGELLSLRGDLIPIHRLHRLFHIKNATEDPTRGLLVVVGEGDGRCALLVDELLGQQQVVAKTLGDGIGKVEGVSGGAILGDGRVGLILDPPGLASMARNTHF